MLYNGYRIETADSPNFKVIKPEGRGSIPTSLTGLYTSSYEAQKAIDLYRSAHEAKVKSNASKKSSG